MKNSLSSADLAMWIALIAGKLVLCLCILKKHFIKRLASFSLLAFVSSIKSLILFGIAFWASYATYYRVFYISGYIESALVFLTLLECGRRVLPGLNLPQKEKAFLYLLIALGAVVLFVSLWPLRSIANEKRIDVGANLSTAIVFIFITVYSRYLGLYWSRLIAGVSSVLGLLCLVQGTARALTGHYPLALILAVRQINEIANVLAVIAWIIVVLSPWGESVMTEEDLQTLEAAFAKIEDSLGTERVKAI
jgi:uncharacterized membrane protein YwzB